MNCIFLTDGEADKEVLKYVELDTVEEGRGADMVALENVEETGVSRIGVLDLPDLEDESLWRGTATADRTKERRRVVFIL